MFYPHTINFNSGCGYSQSSEKMEGQNPEDMEYVEPLPPPEPIYEDNKWFGVPPKGERPLPGKWNYVLIVVGIIFLEIAIWAVYRYTTAPLFVGFGTELFYLAHIIAAPTIHIIPILLFWKFLRKERGLPFVFTKKLLMSGVIVGFVGAIIWRFLEEVIYDGVAGAAGGTVPGTFTFFNLMDSSTMTLLALMTFVHFFIVGPVEELEFRGFAQDQAARVIPNWQALMLSSVLFGCSHIPIAVFVYKFPPHIFVVALIGWMSAGVVFGALYMWSRSIFACIVMHGMGNWQLSVFYFQSTALIGGMDSFTTVLVGTVSSVIADAIMILIFFLIHKFYWQPHRRGDPAFGGIFLKLQDFVHEHDFERKPVQITGAILIAFMVVVCAMLMGVTSALGETDLSKMFTHSMEDYTVWEEEEQILWHYELAVDDSYSGTLLLPSGGTVKNPGVTVAYHDFEVPENSTLGFFNVTVSGTAVRPDFDLRIYGPDGEMVAEAATEAAEESLIIEYRAFNRTGAGTWRAEVDNYSSFNIGYTLTIQIHVRAPIEDTEENEGD
jgi:membrane protease YdiL (CAAX protease family)